MFKCHRGVQEGNFTAFYLKLGAPLGFLVALLQMVSKTVNISLPSEVFLKAPATAVIKPLFFNLSGGICAKLLHAHIKPAIAW